MADSYRFLRSILSNIHKRLNQTENANGEMCQTNNNLTKDRKQFIKVF